MKPKEFLKIAIIAIVSVIVVKMLAARVPALQPVAAQL